MDIKNHIYITFNDRCRGVRVNVNVKACAPRSRGAKFDHRLLSFKNGIRIGSISLQVLVQWYRIINRTTLVIKQIMACHEYHFKALTQKEGVF